MRAFVALPWLLLAPSALAASEDPRPVRVQTVEMQPAGPTSSFSGAVHARTLADLGFRVGGKIVERPVEVGDHVTAGQVLARLDDQDLRLSAENAQNAVAAAQADAAQARADFGRYAALGRASPSYLPSEYDRRVALSRMADARLAQAVRQLGLARHQLAYAVLVADVDGVVTALPVEVGQVVTAGQTVASVAHAGALEVWVDLPENRLAAVRAARVTVSPWSDPALHMPGTIREVGALADPATRTFTVKVALPAAPSVLALGMTMTVAFAARDSEAVARLPASSLTDSSGAPAVWVLGGDAHAHLRRITVAGYDGDGDVIVSAGLAAGERVITAGADLVDPDMRLTAWAGPAR